MEEEEKNKKHCPTCGSVVSEREIALYRGLLTTLWRVYKHCEQKGAHEFERKEVSHLFSTESDTARFGDLAMFGGLVYKISKAHYGLNMERCGQFFNDLYEIPTRIWKHPVTKELRKEDYRILSKIPNMVDLLNQDGEFEARYRNRRTDAPATSVMVPSQTRATEYELYRLAGGGYGCSCPGYRFRKTCKHVEAYLQENRLL